MESVSNPKKRSIRYNNNNNQIIQLKSTNSRKFLLYHPDFIIDNYDYSLQDGLMLSKQFNEDGKIFDLMALDTFHDFQYEEGYYMITKPNRNPSMIHQLFPQFKNNVECKNKNGIDCFNKHKNYTNKDIEYHYGYIFGNYTNRNLYLNSKLLLKVIQDINNNVVNKKVIHSIDTDYGNYCIDKDYCGNIPIDEFGDINSVNNQNTNDSDSSNYHLASLNYQLNTGYIFTIHQFINNKYVLQPQICIGAPNGIVIGNSHNNYELYHKTQNNCNTYNRIDEANNVFHHIHSFSKKFNNEGDLCSIIELNENSQLECIFWVSFCFSTYETQEGYEFLKDKVINYITFLNSYEEVEELHLLCIRLKIFVLGGMICKSNQNIYNGIYLTYFGVNQDYKHAFIGKVNKKLNKKIESMIIHQTDTENGKWIVFNRNVKIIYINISKFELNENEYHNSKSIIKEFSKDKLNLHQILLKLKTKLRKQYNSNLSVRSVIGGNIIQNELGYYCHFFHHNYIFYRNIEDIANTSKVFENLKSVFRILYFNKQFGDFSNIININILLSKLTPEEQYKYYHHYIFHTGDKTACLYAVLCGINTILYQKQDNKYGRILFIDKNKKYIQENLLKQSKQISIEYYYNEQNNNQIIIIKDIV